jgi:hypothetical protein
VAAVFRFLILLSSCHIPLTWTDAILTVSWMAVFLFIGWRVGRKRYPKQIVYYILLPGLLLRMIGGCVVGIVYSYYYTVGDTRCYYVSAVTIADAFRNNCEHGLALWLHTPGSVKLYSTDFFPYYAAGLFHHDDWTSYLLIKITAVAELLTFNSYYAGSLFLSIYAFIGCWCIFSIYRYYYPALSYYIATPLFFLPSVNFWGAGILKDSLTLGTLGICFYTSIQLISIIRSIKINFLLSGIFFFNALLLLNIKPYVFWSFIPFLSLILCRQLLQHPIFSIRFRWFLGISIILGLVCIYYFFVLFSPEANKYSITNILDFARNYRNELYAVTLSSTIYNMDNWMILPEPKNGYWYEYIHWVMCGLLTAIFRPWIGESRSFVILIAGIENLGILLITLYACYRMIRHFKLVLLQKWPMLIEPGLFSLFYLCCMGLIAVNLGALYRYRLPGILFYLISMIILSFPPKFSYINKKK